MNKKYQHMLLQLVAFYIAILIIPLAVILTVYFSALSTLRSYSQRKSEEALSTLQKNIDNRIRELEPISLFVASNTNLSHIYSNGDDFYSIYSLSKSLPNFSLTNTISQSVQIYLKSCNYVITPTTAVPLTKPFFDSLTNSPGKIDLEAFQEQLYENTYLNSCVTIQDDTGETNLYFVNSWPGNGGGNLGAVVIPINKLFLEASLRNISEESDRFSFILDAQQNLIADYRGSGFPMDSLTAGDVLEMVQQAPPGYLVSTAASSYNGWVYYSIVSENSIFAEVSPFQRLLLLLAALSAVTCLLLTCYMLREKVLIGRRVFSSGACPEKLTLRDLKRADNIVGDLLDKNVVLSESLATQQSLIRFSIIRRLMYGDFFDSKELNHFGDILQLDSPNGEFVVFIVSFRCREAAPDTGINASSVIGLYVKTYLEAHIPERCYSFDLSENSLAVLIFNSSGKEGFLADILTLLEGMAADLLQSNDVHSKSAVSSLYRGISSIHKAYREAYDAYLYLEAEPTGADGGKHILAYADLPENNDIYYYPIDLELRLLQSVKHGNREELSALFHQLYQENFVNRNLSMDMVKQFVYAMRSTIIRGLKDIITDENVSHMVQTLSKANTIDEIFNCVVRINTELCRIFQEDREEKCVRQKQQITDYILAFYDDSSLNASRLAGEMGVSESTLYQICKESLGMSFADFLEQTRIHQACTFLKENRYRVKEISSKVGYNSDASFRRAFKRVLSITPTEFLQSLNP